MWFIHTHTPRPQIHTTCSQWWPVHRGGVGSRDVYEASQCPRGLLGTVRLRDPSLTALVSNVGSSFIHTSDYTTLSRCQCRCRLVSVQGWPRGVASDVPDTIVLLSGGQRSAAGGSSPHPGGVIRILRIQTSDLGRRGGPTFGGPSCPAYFGPFHPHLSNICLGVEYSWPECPCPSPASDSHHTSCCRQISPAWCQSGPGRVTAPV